MRRSILAAIVAAALFVSPVAAANSTGWYIEVLPAGETTVGYVTTDSPGLLYVTGYFHAKGGTVSLTGPASCTNGGGRYPLNITCGIADAPAGEYTITITSRKGDVDVSVYVEGNISAVTGP